MSSTSRIKRKIKSIGATRQITRAMNFVSAAKLQKTAGTLSQTRPYANQTREVIASVVSRSTGVIHPFFTERERKSALIIAIASDRGLCGGFNSNVARECIEQIKQNQDVKCITVGDRLRNQLLAKGVEVYRHYPGISEKPDWALASELGATAEGMFLSGETAEIYVIYTRFKSAITFIPTVLKLLPLEAEGFSDGSGEPAAQTFFEPSEEEVLSAVIPKYINIQIYGALIESCASQQGARAAAMGAATENAEEMLEDCAVLYSRARQSAITREITEIAGVEF